MKKIKVIFNGKIGRLEDTSSVLKATNRIKKYGTPQPPYVDISQEDDA